MLPRILLIGLFAFALLIPAGQDPWTSDDVLAPAKFAAVVSDKGEQPPVYYVGFNVLYRNNLIPGGLRGTGPKPEGLELLNQALKDVPRDRESVLYCGCCPIDKCPNLRPAFQAARDLGFKKVRATTV